MRRMIAAMAALTMLGTAGVAAAQARQERSGSPVQRMDHGPDRHGPDGMDRGARDGRGPMGGPGRMGPPSPERMFTAMDANRDGSVSRAEFDAFHTRMRAMRGRHGGHGMGPGGRMGPGAERQDGRRVDPGVHPYPKPTR